MAKLTKAQAKAHQQACEILEKDVLTDDDKFFVLENWQESASHINTVAGAFFTPLELAMDFAIEAHDGRVIDLCAGIGMLSFAMRQRNPFNTAPLDITCVEINPDYIAVGRKIVPEATWIQASVLDVLDMNLGHFDFAISNPPFGKIARPEGKKAPRYTGAEFEFHVVDIASHLASYGVFILPQMSAGFNYSGKPGYTRQSSGKAFDFQQKTGLTFEAGCGVDTAFYQDKWRGVAPLCEIVCVDFEEKQVEAVDERVIAPKLASVIAAPTAPLEQLDLFGAAA
ncbi:methyltransferase [Sinorhizobium medicae]|nr:methyltransferase [Sinorhizobium meliloti]MDX0409138.1 methyltransferase [Sinorhizobium medicae]MDX0421130.1 methyltransferase [Sinorhizobium medicae]MDX1035553.1 methyltransferase [Sinorhizobium medicae]